MSRVDLSPRSWTPERKARYSEWRRLNYKPKRPPVPQGDGTALVSLSKDAFAIINVEDIDLVSRWTWHLHSAGYATAKRLIDGTVVTVYMHRLICPVPPSLEVDHANGNRLDNRRVNLRPATISLQRANQVSRPGSRSRYRGVTATSGKAHPWLARLGRTSLGVYATEEEAARAVDVELRHVYGEYARLNFPEDQVA